MFLKLTKSGGRHYAQLVESFRNEDGQPRQRTICTLGRLEPGGDVDKLIAALQRARGLEAPAASNPLDGLRFEGSRCAGDVWALWQLWRSLGFDDLAAAWRRSRVEVDVLGCLRAMVFNRLCDPSSKLGVLRWLQTVSMPGIEADKLTHQHLLRSMDALMDHQQAVDDCVAQLLRPLIDEDLSVVFYDLTTVEVAGQAVVDDDVRAYGMSKSGQVARQFMLSLVQTAMSPTTAMSQWLSEKEAPGGFSIDRECVLKQPDSEKATVRYARHTLDIDEVGEHIRQGKLPTQLAMTWMSRVSFVLTDTLTIRKIKLLDVVLRDKAEQREAARVRMVEWFGLCPDPAVKDRAQRRLAMYLN